MSQKRKHVGTQGHTEYTLPVVRNATLDRDYYATRAAQAAARRKASNPLPSLAKELRRQEVADAIKTHGRSGAVVSARCGEALVDSVYGDMLLGKYGGVL